MTNGLLQLSDDARTCRARWQSLRQQALVRRHSELVKQYVTPPSYQSRCHPGRGAWYHFHPGSSLRIQEATHDPRVSLCHNTVTSFSLRCTQDWPPEMPPLANSRRCATEVQVRQELRDESREFFQWSGCGHFAAQTSRVYTMLSSSESKASTVCWDEEGFALPCFVLMLIQDTRCRLGHALAKLERVSEWQILSKEVDASFKDTRVKSNCMDGEFLDALCPNLDGFGSGSAEAIHVVVVASVLARRSRTVCCPDPWLSFHWDRTRLPAALQLMLCPLLLTPKKSLSTTITRIEKSAISRLGIAA